MTANLSASVLARLLELAKQRGDNYNLLLNRFALERLLCRVAASPHADRFLLKGALLFSLWYDQPHRPTRDADLLGFGPDDADSVVVTFRDIAAIALNDGIAATHSHDSPGSAETHSPPDVDPSLKMPQWCWVHNASGAAGLATIRCGSSST